MRARTLRGRRRGLTILEMLIASAISVAAVSVLVQFVGLNTRMWMNGINDSDSQRTATLAIQEMTQHIRSARNVVTAESSSTRLTLQLPAYDSSGRMRIPIQNGNKVSYYLAGPDGFTSSGNGSFLWRDVNGTQDRTWSVRGGSARIPIAPMGLSFTYHPTTDPESVTVNVTTRARQSSARTFTTTQEVVIRNRGLKGG